MKKNILKIVMGIFIFSLFFMVSCEDSEVSYPVDHAYVTTSFGNVANVVQVNGTMSFIDLSRGLKSRIWTFPDNTVDTSYNKLATSTLPVVKVRFTTPGNVQVHITQLFNDTVWANGKKQDTASFDSIINVTVLDSVRSSFTAQRALDLSSLALPDSNLVIAGRVVNFTSTSTGTPSTVNWKITRSDGVSVTLIGANVSYKFANLGTYSVTMSSYNAFGSSVKIFKNFVTVIPSTDPVTLDDVNRNATNVIGLVFSRSMQAPTAIDISALTVSITNGGGTIPVKIQSVTATDNIVKITLSTNIYSSDIIKVSYDNTIGDLTTTDAVKAPSFSNVQLMNFQISNLLTGSAFDYGFENSLVTDWPYQWWGGNWGMYTLAISENQKHSGNKSAYIDYQPNGGMIVAYKPSGTIANFTVVPGVKYSLGVWIYMVNLGTTPSTQIQPDLRFYWSTSTDWNVGGITFDRSFPIGKWVYRSITVTAPVSFTNSLLIRGYNLNNPSDCLFYMDDITLTKVEDRP